MFFGDLCGSPFASCPSTHTYFSQQQKGQPLLPVTYWGYFVHVGLTLKAQPLCKALGMPWWQDIVPGPEGRTEWRGMLKGRPRDSQRNDNVRMWVSEKILIHWTTPGTWLLCSTHSLSLGSGYLEGQSQDKPLCVSFTFTLPQIL